MAFPLLKTDSSRQPEFDRLMNTLPRKITRGQKSIIKKAYLLAADAHKFQNRLSGEPYIIHPLAVATKLAGLNLDHETISAALLHDVIEDTEISKEYIETEFGTSIAYLVDGVTKISVLKSQSAETKQATNIRKMILATVNDGRVILIKLADKLHNMKTLDHHRPEKRERIARETLDIYAPLAGRLGIYRIKWELEDLSLYYLDRERYREIKNYISEKRHDREERIQAATKILSDKLKENRIKAEIEARNKHFYSIYVKLTEKGKSLEEIFDYSGARILVNSIQDCYAAMGIVHTIWNPIPGRFKDYISVPKTNGYQSLHTTVVGLDGRHIEIQIRTRQMHRIAEFGIAAHWAYKEKVEKTDTVQEHYKLLQNIATLPEEGGDPEQFMAELKQSLSNQDEVYVFTPQGEIITLPAGATVLDFAFRIHTELGLKCSGAKIQDRLVSIRTPVRSGDQIQIITSPHVKPTVNWLNFLVTSQARSKARAELRRLEALERAPEKTPGKANRAGKAPQEVTEEPAAKNRSRSPRHIIPEIEWEGQSGLDIRFANCCEPQPGDLISGYITQGRGLSIHKKDCPSLKALRQKPENARRIVHVKWKGGPDQFTARIRISAGDRSQLYLDLVTTLASAGADIVEAHARTLNGGQVADEFTLLIDSDDHLRNIVEEISHVAGVEKVTTLD